MADSGQIQDMTKNGSNRPERTPRPASAPSSATSKPTSGSILAPPRPSAQMPKLSPAGLSTPSGAPKTIPGTKTPSSDQLASSLPPRPSVPGTVPPKPANSQSSQNIASQPQSPTNSEPSAPHSDPAKTSEAENQVSSTPSGNVENPKKDAKPVENTIPPGTRIDERYEIVGVLGTGGFATVYRAHHLMIDRDVALKVMDIQKGVDPGYKERFFREAKIAAKIHHNNVVTVYDFGVVSQTQQPYIAMEMLRGHDLSHELAKNGPLSPKRAFTLFRPVLDALAEGHRQGIVHKDLKPENLYLTDPGGPHECMKVLDFGVARLDSGEVAKLTSAGQLLGTPRYLAPEYIKTQLVTPAIDVYQMALILSEALIGIPAVSGDPYSAMMHHCQGDLCIADSLLEGEVGQIFCKAIALDNTQRYQNCEEFGKALDTIEHFFESNVPIVGGDPQATPERHVSSKVILQTGNIKPIATTSLTASIRAPKAKKKNILPIILLIVFVSIGLLFAIVVVLSKKSQHATQPAAQPTADSLSAKEEKLSFSFDSKPAGASVMLEGVELCKTPCSREFKKNETNQIIFVLAGYKDSEAVINETTHTLKNGKFFATLEKKAKPEIIFSINVTPSDVNATLYGTDGIPRRCKGECKYQFDPNEATETELTISAAGYNEQTFTISETANTNIQIELVKAVRKASPKPTTSKPTEPAPQPTAPPPAAPKPKPEPKPTFQFL